MSNHTTAAVAYDFHAAKAAIVNHIGYYPAQPNPNHNLNLNPITAMKDTLKLIDEITKSQPSEFVVNSHAEYFKEYGFKSSVRNYRWVWIFDRLIKEDRHELERLLALSKS